MGFLTYEEVHNILGDNTPISWKLNRPQGIPVFEFYDFLVINGVDNLISAAQHGGDTKAGSLDPLLAMLCFGEPHGDMYHTLYTIHEQENGI